MEGETVHLRGTVALPPLSPRTAVPQHRSLVWEGQWAMQLKDLDSPSLTSPFRYSCENSACPSAVESRLPAKRQQPDHEDSPESYAPASSGSQSSQCSDRLHGFIGAWLHVRGMFFMQLPSEESVRVREQSICLQIAPKPRQKEPFHEVRGFGWNKFAPFTLSGTFDPHSCRLDVVKEYQNPRFCPTARALSMGEMYSLIQRVTGSIGGNGSGGAIYGELTSGSFQKVVDVLKSQTGFCSDSTFLDVGSGLGKPNFHVAIDPGVKVSYGVELLGERWLLSLCNLRAILKVGAWDVARRTFFANCDAMNLNTLAPFTHIYSFDEGFPPQLLDRLVAAFNKSPYARCLCSFDKTLVEDHDLDAERICSVPITMTGSGEGKTCWIYFRSRERYTDWAQAEAQLIAAEQHAASIRNCVACRNKVPRSVKTRTGRRVKVRKAYDPSDSDERAPMSPSNTKQDEGEPQRRGSRHIHTCSRSMAAAKAPELPRASPQNSSSLPGSFLSKECSEHAVIAHAATYRDGHRVFAQQNASQYLTWVREQLDNNARRGRRREAPKFHEHAVPLSSIVDKDRIASEHADEEWDRRRLQASKRNKISRKVCFGVFTAVCVASQESVRQPAPMSLFVTDFTRKSKARNAGYFSAAVVTRFGQWPVASVGVVLVTRPASLSQLSKMASRETQIGCFKNLKVIFVSLAVTLRVI